MKVIREGTEIKDNVTVVLTDIYTGKQRFFSEHNMPLTYAFHAFSQWIAGKNNTGYQPIYSPSKCSLGSGSGTPAKGDSGLFTPIANGTESKSYANADDPTSGTTTFVFQFPAGQITTQVTESWMSDINGNGWFHTMFNTPFTPSSSENITVKWETTFA